MDNTFTTEIVRGLFGPNISSVLFAYKCSHQRASGRLYITSNALCFYSNIFGFERKLMIRMSDITFAGLTRSTSIIIRSKCSGTTGSRTGGDGGGSGGGGSGGGGGGIANINSGSTAVGNSGNHSHHHHQGHVFFEEEHVLKSFDEREVVLREILNLIEKVNNTDNENTASGSSTNSILHNADNGSQNHNHGGGAPIMTMKRFETPFMMNMSKRGILNRIDKSINNSYEDNSSVRSLRLRTYSDPRDHDTCTYGRRGSASGATGSTNTPTANRIRFGSTPDWMKNKEFNLSSNSALESPSPPHSTKNSRMNLASSRFCDSTTAVKSEHQQQQQQPQLEGKEEHITTQSKSAKITTLNERILHFEKCYPEVITKSLILPNYTVDTFYKKFLDNDAPCSFEVFQRTVIKDENINLSTWKKVSSTVPSPSPNIDANDFEELTRTLTFLHLRKKSKIGPSTAQTTRKQILTIYGSMGIVLSTTTKLEGVPYSDCFLVEDQWIIESLQGEEEGKGEGGGGGGIKLSIRMRVNFVKSTIMKKIINRQSKEEVKKWFNLYLPYLSSGEKLPVICDAREESRQDDTRICEENKNNLDYHLWISTPYTMFVVLLFAITVFHIRSVSARVMSLEALIEELKTENEKILNIITMHEKEKILQQSYQT